MKYSNYGTCYDSNKIRPTRTRTIIPQTSTEICYKGTKLMGVCRTSFLLFVYFVIYILYLLCGAAVFSVLEGPTERAVKKTVDEAVQLFLREFPTVSDAALDKLIKEVIKANNQGVSAFRNASVEPSWSFAESLFFTTTLVTTIGYGHVTPLTRSGKIFCMTYAAIGIPLTLVLLSALVERLLTPSMLLLQWLNSKFRRFYRPFNIRLLHLLVTMFTFTGLFLLIPAAIFNNMEPEWNYLDSFYYCFISLTTVGLGDLVPGETPNQTNQLVYKIGILCYLFLGLTFMMLSLAVFYDIPQLNLGLLFTNKDDYINVQRKRLISCNVDLEKGNLVHDIRQNRSLYLINKRRFSTN